MHDVTARVLADSRRGAQLRIKQRRATCSVPLLARMPNELRTCRIVHKVRDRPIPYGVHCLVDDMKGHKEPFSGVHWMTKPVVNGQVKLCRREYAMEYGFQFCTLDTRKLVRGDDLDVRQEVGGV